MRGLTSIGAATVLLAIAGWTVMQHGFGITALAFAAGSLVLLYRGLQGQGIGSSADDASDTIDFFRNPAGAIVESAVGTLGDFVSDDGRKGAERVEQAEPSFDPDAALARYMANRPEPAPAVEATPSPPQFGRKGLTPGS
jgi:hypothetical protein